MKKVIVYYSYHGNTKSIAEMIQKSTGADIARIETVVPYDGDYNSVVNQGQDEVNSGYCPEIKSLNIDLSKYDEVILGTPVWWYTFAPQCTHFSRKMTFRARRFIRLQPTAVGLVTHSKILQMPAVQPM